MKMNAPVTLVGIALVLSLGLQGCVNSMSGLEEAEEDIEAEAECMGKGKFRCNGPWKEWCAEQERMCTGSIAASPAPAAAMGCTPRCTWECKTKKCDQVCAPKCGAALCSTRCKHMDPLKCRMECGQPNCKVVAPPHGCPNGACPGARTECGAPTCKPVCDNPQEAACHQVCAKPHCKFECKKPTECPKPECHMNCETPSAGCSDHGAMAQQLPPLQPGETEVSVGHTQAGAPSPAAAAASPAAASSLLKIATSEGYNHTQGSVLVHITTMDKDRKTRTSLMDMQLMPMASPVTWSRRLSKHHGKTTSSEASCANGQFKCQGDAAWCTKEQKIVCKEEVEEEQKVDDQLVAEAEQPEPMDVAPAADDADKEAELAAQEALAKVGDETAASLAQRRARLQGHLRA